MKLSKLYTNNKSLFPPIIFNDGFNVVRGRVTNFSEKKKDSHNLGKTLLIDVIDFCLLRRINENFFTNKIPKKYHGLEFYLELSLGGDKYLTIKRKIDNNTKISFFESVEKHRDLTIKEFNHWDKSDLPLEKSKEFLDGKLNLTSITPYNYRKGISYFLRKQNDYLDVFQVFKFSAGKHVSWKPYIGKILGFSEKTIEEKYKASEKVVEKDKELEILRSKTILPDESVDKIRARTEAETELIKKMEYHLDLFDFKEADLQISQVDLAKIENDISYLNNEIYNYSIDLRDITQSLETKIIFKVKNIQKILDEANLHLKESTLKSYKELEDFNRRLTKDRSIRLIEEKKRVSEKLIDLKKQLSVLSSKRAFLLKKVREKDSFKKYKLMQNDLVLAKNNLEKLRNDLHTLKSIKDKSKELEDAENELDLMASKIQDEIDKNNDTLTSIRSYFRELITSVLNTGGLLYIDLNTENNFEFKASYTKEADPTSPTSEGEGNSYQKLLCVFFDMAVLRYYSEKRFYKFVYHDGVLEGLDDRKKDLLLSSIKKYCELYDLQYILTVIDADLPLDDEGHRVEFEEDEIIKALSDDGKEGRLFKCEIF